MVLLPSGITGFSLAVSLTSTSIAVFLKATFVGAGHTVTLMSQPTSGSLVPTWMVVLPPPTAVITPAEETFATFLSSLVKLSCERVPGLKSISSSCFSPSSSSSRLVSGSIHSGLGHTLIFVVAVLPLWVRTLMTALPF